MRPLELRLREFRSYAGGDTVFSFRDRRLLGIVGPIGSGKSTILDAIAFALYGRTASIGRGTKALIHQRADSTTVALRFAVDDQVWEVQRLLRRSGAGQHALYRLDGDTEQPEHLETVLQEGDVNLRIIELLGLDFAAFGRSVMLAQGRFAEFLTAPPAERDKVLKGVFGHDRIDRMRDLAKQRATELEVEAEKIAFRVAHITEVLEAADARREEVAVVELRATTLEKARPEVEELDAAERESDQRLQTARQRSEELRELAGRLPDVERSAAILSDIEKAVERRAAVSDDLDRASVALTEAEQALADLESRGERERLERAGQLVATLGHQEAARDTAGAAEQDAESRLRAAGEVETERRSAVAIAEHTVAAVDADLARANADVAAANAALHAARHRDMATALRSDLTPGDTCPVCEQSVGDVPPLPADADLATAEQAVHRAEAVRSDRDRQRAEAVAGLEAARAALAAAEAHRSDAAAGLEHATATLAAAVADREATHTELCAELDSHEPTEVLPTRRRRLTEVVDAAAAARRGVEQARRAHDEAIAAEQAAKRNADDLRMQLIDVAARLGQLDIEHTADPEGIRRALHAVRSAWESEQRRLASEAEQAESDRDAVRARRGALVETLDLRRPLADELADARARAEVLTDEIARAEAQQATLAGLTADQDTLVRRRDLSRRLAGDLTDARFIRFLLDEERSRLADLGSDHFQRLSGGRYRFTEDGEFGIVDLTAAEAVRKADSLSGGETFLASLGLALALAEMVARTGGRLDAFFLDEGFGTLDPEHLDLAMEGIESLAVESESRLVVVVSHVAELRHRIEDLIELERNPTTGSTRVVRA